MSDTPTARRPARRRPSIAGQVLLWQLALVLLLITAGSVVAVRTLGQSAEDAARERALAVARTLAQAPGIAEAVSSSDPSARLQPVAESVRHENDVDFVVVMSTAGIRFTHPDPGLIGGRFVGHIDAAVRGEAFTESYTGSLGPSVRAVVPMFAEPGAAPGATPVALVAVGVTERHIDSLVWDDIPLVVLIAAGALTLAGGAAVAVHRRLRRQTLGLGPDELRRMYEHHDAVLHAVREGLVVLDGDGRLMLANDEAIRLLALPADFEGRDVRDPELDLDETLAATLAAGHTVEDELHVAGDRVLTVNVKATERDGHVLGAVATLRDHTELRALVGELDEVRSFAEALRASAHEAGNRLHTVVALIELGRPEDAVRFATGEIAASQLLADRLTTGVREPVVAALLFGKHAQAAERGVHLTVTADRAPDLEAYCEPGDLVTVLGNLVDNAIDAAASAPPPRTVEVTVEAGTGPRPELVVVVADSGPGVDAESAARIFERGWSTKASHGPQGRGLGLALVRQITERHGGAITVAQRPCQGAEFTVRMPLDTMPERP
ncbi:sensor histidine kinase [Yinghuangia sp. ASG 101]|uniref:sensor histidine kinase n=1 Tax=Yinghuangia sp. ASG 101 TaxID=2896848 RepID=UPI001E467E4E|nr:sensor histidine kinase [Yinghuangia sp. ASG 101]UGQ11488.1 sensor histidine kinase [Yinghuangia sp. ASG 101]